MKKKITIISVCIVLLSILLIFMTVLLVSGCTEYKFEDRVAAEETDVMISIMPRKANGQEGSGTYVPETRVTENEIKSAFVLVYNASRIFEKSKDMGTGTPVTLTLRKGKKSIFIVANASDALKAKLNASPSYATLIDLLSEDADYNAGKYPAQGLLMSGKAEQTIAVGSANAVKVKLNYCMTRIALYLRKGSNDVDNITIKTVKLNNARNKGYLYKEDMYSSKVSNTVTPENTQITSYTAGSDGTLIAVQYTYPTVNATDIAFEISLNHANTASADTYTIYLNESNTASNTTLQPNNQYKVIVTFSKDESGTLSVTAFTEKIVDFDIG